MSHYVRVRTKIRKKAALLKALADMGFKKVEVYDKPVSLMGYQDDYREDQAHIVLRKSEVGGLSNDIGFLQLEDGTFEAIISEYDRNNSACRKNELTQGMSGYNEKWEKLLTARYSKHVIEDEARAQGYYIQGSTVDEDGNIYVKVESSY